LSRRGASIQHKNIAAAENTNFEKFEPMKTVQIEEKW